MHSESSKILAITPIVKGVQSYPKFIFTCPIIAPKPRIVQCVEVLIFKKIFYFPQYSCSSP